MVWDITKWIPTLIQLNKKCMVLEMDTGSFKLFDEDYFIVVVENACQLINRVLFFSPKMLWASGGVVSGH